MQEQNANSGEMIKLLLVDSNPVLCSAWGRDLPEATVIHKSLTVLPQADCLVIPSDSFGSFSGGISRTWHNLFEKERALRAIEAGHPPASESLYNRIQKTIVEQYDGFQPVGTCILLETNNPKIPFVAHVPTMPFTMDISKTPNAFLALSAVLHAVMLHNQTATFPIKTVFSTGLGTGTGRLDCQEAAQQMANAYYNYLSAQIPGKASGKLAAEPVLPVQEWPETYQESSVGRHEEDSVFFQEAAEFPTKSRTLLQMLDHDARNYLYVISQTTKSISNALPPDSQDRFRDNLDSIKNAADLLLKLIDDLSNYDLIKTAKIKLSFAPVNIVEVLGTVIDQLSSKMQQSGIRCCLNTDNGCSNFIADVDWWALNRVFFNVLLNAVKYSPAQTEISVNVTHPGKEFLVLISDKGCGISKENWEAVFEPYVRANRQESGRGLGLTIARELLTLMKGEIGVQKSVAGQGTTIFIRVPRCPLI